MDNNKPKFLKNILATSALTLGMALSLGNVAYGANATPNVSPALIGTPAGWVGGASPVPGDNLIFAAANGQIQADVDIILGNITGVAGGNNIFAVNAGRNVSINNFLGVGAGAVISFDAAGVANLTIRGNQLQVDAIDMAGNASHLRFVNTADLTIAPVAFGAGGGFINHKAGIKSIEGTGKVIDPFAANSAAISQGVLNIGTAATPGHYVSQPVNANAVGVGAAINFVNANSQLTFDSSKAGKVVTWGLFGVNIGGAADGFGIVNIVANGQDVQVTRAAAETIGANGRRIKALNLSGTNRIGIDVGVYAQQINQTAGFAGFGQVVDTGVTGLYNLGANTVAVLADGFNGNMNFGNNIAYAAFTGDVNGNIGSFATGSLSYAPNGGAVFVGTSHFTGTALIKGVGFSPQAATDILRFTPGAAPNKFDLGVINQFVGAARAQIVFDQGFILDGGINNSEALNSANAAVSAIGAATGLPVPPPIANLSMVDLIFHGGIIGGDIGTKGMVGTISSDANQTLAGVVNAMEFELNGAAHTLAIGQSVNPNAGVTFNTNGIFKLNNNVDQVLGDITVTAAGAAGTIDASALDNSKTLTLGQTLGAGNLVGINIQNANLVIQGGNYGQILFAVTNPYATISLAEQGGDYTMQLAHNPGSGILKVIGAAGGGAGTHTINAASILSTADNPLNAVLFSTTNGLQQLILEDGQNLFTVNGIGFDAAGGGNIVSRGNSTITGPIGVGANGGAISHQGAAGTILTVMGNVALDDDIFVQNAGAEIIMSGASINAAAIYGAGIVTFNNPTGAIINSDLGTAANPLDTVRFFGGNMSVTSIGATNVELDAQPKTITITSNTSDFSNTTFTTTSTTADQYFVTSAPVVINNPFGTAANPFGGIIINAGQTITVNNPYFGSFYTTTPNTGIVDIITGNSQGIKDIGTKDNPFATVEFRVDTPMSGSLFAQQANVYEGAVVEFTGKAAVGGEVVLRPTIVASVTGLRFMDDAILGANVTTTMADQGFVAFHGASQILGQIGDATNRLRAVYFDADADGKLQSLQNDIYSEFFISGATILSVDKPRVNINSDAAVLNGTSVNLHNNELAFIDTDVTASGNLTILTEVAGGSAGKLVFSGANADITDNGITGLNVIVTNDVITLPHGTELLPIVAFENGANNAQTSLKALNPALITATLPTNSNGFIEWFFDPATLSIGMKNTATQGVQNILGAQGASGELIKNMQMLFGPDVTGVTADLANELANVGIRDKKAFYDAAVSLMSTDSAVPEVIYDVYKQVTQNISLRTTTLRPGSFTEGKPDFKHELTDSGESFGIAAGDAEQLYARYGVWGSPFYSYVSQKSTKKILGYDADITGLTLGGDTMANDTMTIGAALTYTRADVRYKDNLKGNKAKINNYFASLYGTQLINDDYFVTGIVSFGSSGVKGNYKRIGFLNKQITTQIATSDYDAMSWGGEFLAGYNYRPSEAYTVIPMAGFSYNQYLQAGYTEKGTRNQNRTVTKRNSHKLDLIAGARVIAAAIESDGIVYTPEAHAFIRQDVANKAPKTALRLSGLNNDITPKGAKSPRTVGAVGAALTVQHNNIDTGINYTFSFNNKKYKAHTGSLKVRFNF